MYVVGGVVDYLIVWKFVVYVFGGLILLELCLLYVYDFWQGWASLYHIHDAW